MHLFFCISGPDGGRTIKNDVARGEEAEGGGDIKEKERSGGDTTAATTPKRRGGGKVTASEKEVAKGSGGGGKDETGAGASGVCEDAHEVMAIIYGELTCDCD